MNIVSVSCTSCGAPISIPSDIDRLNCIYCGATLIVQRGEGYVALKLAEQVSKSITESGVQTQSTIRENTYVTQTELKRLQLGQEISSLQIQLSTLQSEIRTLQRQTTNEQISWQLKDLDNQQAHLINRINILQTALTGYSTSISSSMASNESIINSTVVSSTPHSLSYSLPTQSLQYASKDWLVTFILCLFFGMFGAHRFYTGHNRSGFIQLVTMGGFGIWWFADLLLIILGKFHDKRGQILGNANSKMGSSCLASFLAFFVVTLICGFTAIALDSAIFGVSYQPSNATTPAASGPIFTIVPIIAILAAVIAFVYRYNPQAPLWMALKIKLFNKHNKS